MRPRTPIRRCHTAVPCAQPVGDQCARDFPLWPVPAHASAPVRPRSPASSDAGEVVGHHPAVGRPHGGSAWCVQPGQARYQLLQLPGCRQLVTAGRVLPQHAAGPGRRPGDLHQAPVLIRVPASANTLYLRVHVATTLDLRTWSHPVRHAGPSPTSTSFCHNTRRISRGWARRETAGLHHCPGQRSRLPGQQCGKRA